MWKKVEKPKKHVATIRLDADEMAEVAKLMKSEKICKQEAVRRLLKEGGNHEP